MDILQYKKSMDLDKIELIITYQTSRMDTFKQKSKINFESKWNAPFMIWIMWWDKKC